MTFEPCGRKLMSGFASGGKAPKKPAGSGGVRPTIDRDRRSWLPGDRAARGECIAGPPTIAGSGKCHRDIDEG